MRTLLQELEDRGLNLLPALAKASTHETAVYTTAAGKTYYVKFSGELYGDAPAQNLHMVFECMAYRIYALYGIPIPEDVFLVRDKDRDRLGIASQETLGQESFVGELRKLGGFKDTFLPSVLLANYDITGTPPGANILVQKDKYSVIDPGAAFHYRAQGKNKEYGEDPFELQSMRDPQYPAGTVFSKISEEELRGPLKTKFMSVDVSNILGAVDQTAQEAEEKLRKFQDRSKAEAIRARLGADTTSIKKTLVRRHANILRNLS